MGKKTISGELLEVLLESIESLGVKRTLQVLKTSKNKLFISDDNITKFIIASVCKEYDLTLDELKSSNSHYDSKRVEASSILSYLLYNHCKLTQVQIGMILKKDNSVISKYLKRINTLDVKFQPDYVINNRLESFDIVITKYKSNT